jgi:Mg-chelatase subunit ChlD
VLEDVKNTISSVRGDDSTGEVHDTEDSRRKTNVVGEMPSWSWRKAYPSAVSIQASRRFANELVTLKAEHDPGWLRKTSQGKVNVRQFMQGADFDEMFDQWSEGNQDVSDIECVVLVDSSGSMCDMMTPAYEAAWTVKRALDSINASTTVIQFADRGGWLYKASERAQAHIKTAPQGVGGSTHPFSSLKAAKEILTNSPRAIKLLLVVTDGAWGSPQSCDQLIASMRTTGILTSLVFLTEPAENVPYYLRGVDGGIAVDGHKCEFVHHLTNPLQIVDVAKAVTKRAQRALLV